MTRFSNNLSGEMGISLKEYEKLFGYLNSIYSSKLNKLVLNEIDKLGRSKNDYRLLEISDTIIVSIFKSEFREAVRLCVGYPFPLLSKKIKKYFNGHKVSVFIRDEPIRKYQRAYIFKHLQDNYSAEIKTIESAEELKNKLLSTNRNYNKQCFYVDLYDFIGDSIIGLKFLNTLKQTLKIPTSRCTVFSKHNRHIPTQYTLYSLSQFEAIINSSENSTIIIPVLIDNQFDAFLKLLHSIKLTNFRIVIPSRNMFITFSKSGNRLYWYKSRDILFKTNSIDNYMESALRAFSGKNVSREPLKIKVHKLTKKVFINPFSSLAGKSITSEDCSKLCEQLQKQGFKVFVSAGFHQEKYLSKLNVRDVTILHDSGFRDLSAILSSNDIGLVISTDSGIAHMTATQGITTIVIYHTFFWDRHSKQSISNDALGGFCRSHLPMIPVINSGVLEAVEAIYHPTMTRKEKKYISVIMKRMYEAPNKTVFSLHKELVQKFQDLHSFYCPAVLLKDVTCYNSKFDSWSLVSNIWQNLPAYKISKFTFA